MCCGACCRLSSLRSLCGKSVPPRRKPSDARNEKSGRDRLCAHLKTQSVFNSTFKHRRFGADLRRDFRCIMGTERLFMDCRRYAFCGRRTRLPFGHAVGAQRRRKYYRNYRKIFGPRDAKPYACIRSCPARNGRRRIYGGSGRSFSPAHPRMAQRKSMDRHHTYLLLSCNPASR